ncbi:exocyst complex subunit Sec15 [Schizosaccharomyces osmophilus]|uniref:Exocyst complex component SEC15 n=1 Tax=Schizosaccharomyces osmophilus TaxID=2545709 RepID=A0AAF0B063_9SCHI|nr:exocyst complex subunit Sec15 [Schizosaccharomyces osmophilus]WBW75619.1 exocyst complex subunit Sec15 [Schizosaccharomyces osmophilus]
MDFDCLEFVNKIATIESNGDTLDHLPRLITLACQKNQEQQVYQRLNELGNKNAIRVEQLCAENNQDFSKSVYQLSVVRNELHSLRSHIADLNTDIQASGKDLKNMKQQLNSLKDSERRLFLYQDLTQSCLQIFYKLKDAQELLSKKQYLSSLRICSEVQKIYLKRIEGLTIHTLVQQMISKMQNSVCSSALEDLHEWLFALRKKLPLVGEICFKEIDEARRRWAKNYREDLINLTTRTPFSLDLAILEYVDFDPLDNDLVKVDFNSLYVCVQVHSYLGILSSFQASFEKDRKRQQEFLAPKSLESINLEVIGEWLKSVAGYMIVEYYILQEIPNFRSYEEVQNIWAIICDKLIESILRVAFSEQSTTAIIKMKNNIVLLMHTMERFGFATQSLHSLSVELIDAFGGALMFKHLASFEEAFETDLYAPMVINNEKEYDELIAPYWTLPPAPLPRMVEFSKMCSLCCITLSKFTRHFFMFSNDSITLALDVQEKIPRFYRRFILHSLLEKLKHLYPKLNLSQMAQLVKNFYAFEEPLLQMEKTLIISKSTSHAGNENVNVNIKSSDILEGLANARKSALHEIFVKINHKIDDFIGLAEYDWSTTVARTAPSGFLQEMVPYLQTIYLDSLAGLPNHDKSYVYLETLDHLCTAMIDLLSNPAIRRVSSAAAEGFKVDVEYLESFASQVPDQSIVNADSFIELRQCANLLLGDNIEDYMDTDKFNRDFNRLHPSTSVKLLERLISGYSANPLSNDRPKRRAIENLLTVFRRKTN